MLPLSEPTLLTPELAPDSLLRLWDTDTLAPESVDRLSLETDPDPPLCDCDPGLHNTNSIDRVPEPDEDGLGSHKTYSIDRIPEPELLPPDDSPEPELPESDLEAPDLLAHDPDPSLRLEPGTEPSLGVDPDVDGCDELIDGELEWQP